MKVTALLLAAFLTAGVRQEAPQKREMKDRRWVEGEIVCIGCTLSRDFGVDAQCTLHAQHAQGFLDKEGNLWTFVDNARGHHAITQKKLLNQRIRVYGWTFPKHRYIEFWKYELRNEDKWIGYDFCKT